MKKKYCILLRSAFLLTALFAVGACGKVNDEASLINNTGQHSANWVILHGASAAVSTSSCTQCHGADLTGGISKVGCFSTSQSSFSGFVCHATSPAVDTGCKSCHGTPPDGTTAPNRGSAHDTHLALAGISCDTCHANAGAGTLNHAKATASGGIGSATVSSFSDTYKSKIVTTFGYEATSGTCSSIICHGGQTTPSWNTGSIEIATDCLKCHVQGTALQTPQYNSFYSGTFTFPGSGATVNLHQLHLSSTDPLSSSSAQIFCTTCHNTDKLAIQHFSGLLTPAFEGIPASTLGGGNTRIIEYPSTPSGTCTNTCHANRFWVN